MSRKIQETPLYVKLPKTAVDKLDRAAAALGVAKKDLVAGLVSRYVDPDSQRGLSALDSLSSSRPFGSPENGPMLGTYSFQAYDPPDLPEVMNAEQAGQFLQISAHVVIELAEAGKLPGKRLGPAWRFSREALVRWLSTPDTPEKPERAR